MKFHADNYFRPAAASEEPSAAQKEYILYQMEKAYGTARWELPDDYLSYDRFLTVVQELDKTSTPGIPYCYDSPTNGMWLRWNGVEADPFRLAMLWHHVQAVFNDQWDLILRCFVKQEPHKKTKVDLGRWRLIMASPLPVQVAWHMLFDYQNDVEILNSINIPSQQGIVLCGGGWKQYSAAWRHLGIDTSIDQAAWDWTYSFWAMRLELEFRRRQCTGRFRDSWFDLASLLYERMYVNVKISLTDGSIWIQREPGLQKSGCVNTISSNSHGGPIYHIYAAILDGFPVHPIPRVVGDDKLSRHNQMIRPETLKRMGIMEKYALQGVEFVGHQFDEGSGPRPLYVQKHIMSLLYQSDENLRDAAESFVRMYTHSPLLPFWREIARRLRAPLMSEWAYRYWYDYED